MDPAAMRGGKLGALKAVRQGRTRAEAEFHATPDQQGGNAGRYRWWTRRFPDLWVHHGHPEFIREGPG
jgi:hypothetical protein